MSFAGMVLRLVRISVLHEIFTKLVDGLVGKMHVKIAHVGIGRFLLLVGAEPDEPILVQEHAQGVHARHQHVQPEVELESVDEQWLLELLLHHTLLFVHVLDLIPRAH